MTLAPVARELKKERSPTHAQSAESLSQSTAESKLSTVAAEVKPPSTKGGLAFTITRTGGGVSVCPFFYNF